MRHDNAPGLGPRTQSRNSPKKIPNHIINRPFSALNLNLGTPPISRPRIVQERAKSSRLFPLSSTPEFYPDEPVSPRIRARQGIFSGKKGGMFQRSLDARVVSPRPSLRHVSARGAFFRGFLIPVFSATRVPPALPDSARPLVDEFFSHIMS